MEACENSLDTRFHLGLNVGLVVTLAVKGAVAVVRFAVKPLARIITTMHSTAFHT
jgi:hypothetical protein